MVGHWWLVLRVVAGGTGLGWLLIVGGVECVLVVVVSCIGGWWLLVVVVGRSWGMWLLVVFISGSACDWWLLAVVVAGGTWYRLVILT